MTADSAAILAHQDDVSEVLGIKAPQDVAGGVAVGLQHDLVIPFVLSIPVIHVVLTAVHLRKQMISETSRNLFNIKTNVYRYDEIKSFKMENKNV